MSYNLICWSVSIPFEISLKDLYNKVKFEPVESAGERVDGEELG